jgi:hypothetical protein
MAQRSSSEPDLGADFDAWAAVSARLLGRAAPEHAALLAALGIGDGWAASDAKWTARLARDMSNGVLDLVDRYGAICAREMELRQTAEAEWSVERYARYCAELYSWPEQAEQVHARHGLAAPEARALVHDHWRQRLTADRALHDRWAACVAQVRAEIAKPRG